MREDYRYLDIKVDAELDSQKASEIIEESVKSYAGDRGLIKIEPKVICLESDYIDSRMVLRINRAFEDNFRAAIVLSDTRMVTVKVSGTPGSL